MLIVVRPMVWLTEARGLALGRTSGGACAGSPAAGAASANARVTPNEVERGMKPLHGWVWETLRKAGSQVPAPHPVGHWLVAHRLDSLLSSPRFARLVQLMGFAQAARSAPS